MQVEATRLFAKIGELTVALELANERIAELEAAQAATEPAPDMPA